MGGSTSHGKTLVLALALAAGVASASACGGDDATATPAPSADGGADVQGSPALCVDGKPVAWPEGPYELAIGGTLPKDLVFEGPDGPVSLADVFEPCAPKARLLVVRSMGSWCGPCLWHGEHTKQMLSDPRIDGRIVLVDLLLGDEDNAPPSLAGATRWKSKVDFPVKVGIDPKYTFSKATLPHASLPSYAIIDTRTMSVRNVLETPAADVLAFRLAAELAQLDKLPRLEPVEPRFEDELFTVERWDMIRAMKLVATPPPDPTNAFGDLPAAAALGKKLFSDAALSPSGTVSCATCHLQAQGFADGARTSTGLAKLDRNAPSIALAAHSRSQFWDGRADTLWAQALGPFEDGKEMGSTRLYVAKQIAARYAAEYDAVFPTMPRPDLSAAPAGGKPGDAAYDALPKETKDAVTRVFVNVGKAIAAFERSLRVKPNALDRYAGGDLTALTPDQKKGLNVFFRVGCAQCHFGPRLTNDAFHALRFETGRQDRLPDDGRFAVLAGLATAEFTASSPWSDAPAPAKTLLFDPNAMARTKGAFKTPTLRGLPKTAPYGHGGTLATLLDVTRHYGQRGLDSSNPASSGTTEEWVGMFDHGGQEDLVPFLEVLEAETEVP